MFLAGLGLVSSRGYSEMGYRSDDTVLAGDDTIVKSNIHAPFLKIDAITHVAVWSVPKLAKAPLTISHAAHTEIL